ncbi:MAG: hypothetical protein HY741_13100 [Chloroflexi bacterium]|nr:hypothetical protein [Chloroflexota bacterium]
MTTLEMLWLLSIVLMLGVTVVVAYLLVRIWRTAQRIDHVAGQIWTHGKMVAANTIHIPMLRETNRLASGILDTAAKINAGAAAIEQHAEGCPGCPRCVIGR